MMQAAPEVPSATTLRTFTHGCGVTFTYTDRQYATLQRVLAKRDARRACPPVPDKPSSSNLPYLGHGIPAVWRVSHGDPFFWSKWIHENLMNKKHTDARDVLDADIEQKKAMNSKFGDRVPRWNAARWLERW